MFTSGRRPELLEPRTHTHNAILVGFHEGLSGMSLFHLESLKWRSAGYLEASKAGSLWCDPPFALLMGTDDLAGCAFGLLMVHHTRDPPWTDIYFFHFEFHLHVLLIPRNLEVT